MVNTFVVFIFGCITSLKLSTAGNNNQVELDTDWQSWKTFFGKEYEEDEETMRYMIWKTNMKYIMDHAQQNHSYSVAMNHFGDLVSSDCYVG